MRLFRRSRKHTEPAGPTVLHICAHTDDDLYFMSPDLLHALEADARIISVYLTAGEADGRNMPTGDPKRAEQPADFEGYAAARQWGIRAAYAAVLGYDNPGEQQWDRRTFATSGPLTGEVATLSGNSRITLYFLNLRTRLQGEDPQALRTLWNGETGILDSLRPTGSPLPEAPGTLTREQLIATLGELLTQHQPTTVRILDPDPWHIAYDARRNKTESCDHADHTASALFAQEAVARYNAGAHATPVQLQSYVGYGNKLLPNNLPAETAAQKFSFINIYGGLGQEDHPERLLRGDLQLYNKAFNRFYGQSTTHRWLGSTSWLQPLADGRITAFTVRDGEPYQWIGTPEPGSWQSPVPVGRWNRKEHGEALPYLEAAQDTSGRIHLFTLATKVGPTDNDHQRRILTISQTRPDGPFGSWTDLGVPNPTPVKGRETGMPQAIATSEGGVRVISRNFGTGLSSRYLDSSGYWSDWTDLNGAHHEGAAMISTATGRVEILANATHGVLRWVQDSPAHGFQRDYGTLIVNSAAAPTLVENPDSTLTLIVRQPQTGWVLAYRQQADLIWDSQPHFLGHPGGYTRVAAATTPDRRRTTLVTVDNDGHLVHATLDNTGELPTAPLSWHTIKTPPGMHSPSVVHTATGRTVVAYVGLDTHPHLSVVSP